MDASLLVVDGITAGYQGRPVLQNLSIELPAGSLTLLLGPNGHGKTTLLRCISGLIPWSAGDIRFDGASLSGVRPDEIVQFGVIHIPQGDLLFSDMTVEENLLMGAYRCAPDAVTGTSDFVYTLFPKLAERRGQVASSLSGGERRMLGIARGLMAGGRVLMIDEPSLGLAPIIIEQIYSTIGVLKEQGYTVLLVEENAERAQGLADKVYLLDNGRIVWRGSVDEMERRNELFQVYLGGLNPAMLDRSMSGDRG